MKHIYKCTVGTCMLGLWVVLILTSLLMQLGQYQKHPWTLVIYLAYQLNSCAFIYHIVYISFVVQVSGFTHLMSVPWALHAALGT